MRSHHSLPAFTLIEALTALTVLCVGILGVLEALSLGSRAGSEATRLSQALDVAHYRVQTAVAAAGQDVQEDGIEGPYNWKLRVFDAPEGLKVASVTVSWSDRRGTESVELAEAFLPRGSGR